MSTEVNNQTGFSWMALLFAPYYYSGYGKILKGIVFAVLGFIPLTAIIVNLYAATKAKKELPIGIQSFKWAPAIGVFLVQLMITALVLSFSSQFEENTNTSILSEISGIWRANEDGAMVTINLEGQEKYLTINNQQIPIQINGIDTENHIVSLKINANNQDIIWTIQQIFQSDDRFHLNFILHDGTQDELSFVRNLD